MSTKETAKAEKPAKKSETAKATEEKAKTSTKTKKSAFPTYKDRPLVRSGNTIYYGSMKDNYVVRMEIKSKKTVGDLEVANKIAIFLVNTDPAVSIKDQIAKTSEKTGLYAALDIADAWLERANDAAE